jgi:hypothetical protein
MAILIVDLDSAAAGSANETIAPAASTVPKKLTIDLRIAVHKAFPDIVWRCRRVAGNDWTKLDH